MLTIRLLGQPEVQRAGAPVKVTRRKSRALLYYLAAQARPVRREQVLGLLWPDLERTAALQTLRTTLSALRKPLGSGLLAEAETLALDGAAEVDVRTFEAALGRAGPDPARLAAALALYRGDLLEGFSLPDAPPFDDWLAAERERLRRLAVRGWARLAEAHEGRGAYAQALEALEQALAFDALQEDLQRAALRLHYLAGDRAGAVRRYAHLRELLDSEMGVLPMAETRALYDAIINDTLPMPTPAAVAAPPAAATPPAPAAAAPAAEPPAGGGTLLPFVGRAAELQALRGLAPGQLALVEGEPGIGKTRLVEVFARLAGSQLAHGLASPFEQALPYQPIREALRSLPAEVGLTPAWLEAALPAIWRGEVVRLLPELAHNGALPDSPPDEARLWEGLHQLLVTLARQAPLTLFLDDLQWADAATLGWLGYVVRRAGAEATALRLVAATRPVTTGSPIAALTQVLARAGRLMHLPLARLTADEVRTVARQMAEWLAPAAPAGRGGAAPTEAPAVDEVAEWLATASEGNPYVLAELVRSARRRAQEAGGAETLRAALAGEPLVPQSLYSLIQSRLAQLSEPARRVLDVAVAAGREFAFEVVWHAAGLSEAAALDALDELRQAGLVWPLPEPPASAAGLRRLAHFTFDHSLTLEVAYREVGDPRHRRLHRRVAEAMLQVVGRAGVDAVAGVLAQHFAESDAPERAAPYAFRAGQLAAQLPAWTEATAFFDQALQVETRPAARLNAALALGQALGAAGNTARAAEVFGLAAQMAADLARPAEARAARLGLANAYLLQARYAESIRLAQALRAEAEHPANVAEAEFVWGTALSIEGADLAGAAEHLQAAERALTGALAAEQAGPSGEVQFRLAQVKFELGSLAAQQGDLESALALYGETLALARAAGTPDAATSQALALNNLAYHQHLLAADTGDGARLAEAARYAEDGLKLAQAHGLLWAQTYLYSTSGEIALARGALGEAEQAFTEGLALAERLRVPERVAGHTANLGRVALAKGEDALALYRLSTALAQAQALGVRHLAAQVRVWLAPLLPPAEAEAHLAEVRAFAAATGRRRLLSEAGG